MKTPFDFRLCTQFFGAQLSADVGVRSTLLQLQCQTVGARLITPIRSYQCGRGHKGGDVSVGMPTEHVGDLWQSTQTPSSRQARRIFALISMHFCDARVWNGMCSSENVEVNIMNLKLAFATTVLVVDNDFRQQVS
jgi:hypothetical protein